MHINETTIRRFYTAFQNKDSAEMGRCYDDSIVFSDPVFAWLEGEGVRKMWEMLCQRGADLQISFGPIELLDEEYATCSWEARYTFSATGRKVVNRVKAHLRLRDGLITEHSDAFDMYKWCRQALGWKGWLLGWSGFLQNRVRRQALRSLEKFMQKN
jgi:ketosteroid isomerase-like protein